MNRFVGGLAIVLLGGMFSLDALSGPRRRSQGYAGFGVHLGNVSERLLVREDELELNLNVAVSVHGQGADYGMGQFRLMLGNTFGIHLSEMGGVNLLRFSHANPLFLIGLEPFNFNFNASFQGSVENGTNYFEWTPMVAAGLDFDFLEIDSEATCRGIVVARLGGSIGTLGEGRARPAYGAGFHVNCADALNFGADLLRIEDDAYDVDLARVEWQVALDRSVNEDRAWVQALGLRFESLKKHLTGDAHFLIDMPEAGDHVERRGMLIYSISPRR